MTPLHPAVIQRRCLVPQQGPPQNSFKLFSMLLPCTGPTHLPPYPLLPAQKYLLGLWPGLEFRFSIDGSRGGQLLRSIAQTSSSPHTFYSGQTRRLSSAMPTGYSRFCKDVEHGDAFGGLGRVQVVQSGNGVGDPKHNGSFHPVVDQIGVGQASWSKKRSQAGEEEHGTYCLQGFGGHHDLWDCMVYCNKHAIEGTV